MKKTIVLLLSLATIMGCVAAPVAAKSGSFEMTIHDAGKVTEYHGISMNKAYFNFTYKGQPDIKIGLRVNGAGTLYGGKRYTFSSTSYKTVTKYSNQVAQSIGANVPHMEIL